MSLAARPRRKSFLVFGAPQICQAEIDEVVDSLQSGWIGTGKKVQKFEENFGAYKDSSYTVAVNSCTAALHLSLLALDLQPGDEVITTPLTFCATVNAILHSGAIPVLADVDPATMNLDPACVRKKITDRTKALLPVHFAGRPVAMPELLKIAETHQLRVVEDCAHAVETICENRHAGTFGDFGCFSFYATKNMTTAEGGMILCRRQEDMQKIRRMALHGMSADAWRRFSDDGYKHYFVTDPGFKYNMTDIQASLGIHQLKRLDDGAIRRREIWKRYQEAFAPLHSNYQLTYQMQQAVHNMHCIYTPCWLIKTKQGFHGMTSLNP